MSSYRVERKRAHDREAQRVSRARTKAYIAHLEKTVAELSSNNANEREKQLALRAAEQEKAIATLQCTLSKIRNLLKQVTDLDTAVCDDDSPKSSASASSYRDARPSFGKDEALQQREPTATPPSEEFAPEGAAGKSALEDDDHATKQLQANAPTRPDYAQCLGVDLKCNNSAANYFLRLTGVFASLERLDKDVTLSTAKEDDDILARAVLSGWETAAETYPLDIVWQFIRALDEGMFTFMPPVERVASMRQIRSMLLHKIQPTNQQRRPINKSFQPTALQTSQSHFSLPDYFIWPQVRNHLIAAKVTNITESQTIDFARNFRFVWPYELRDVFLKQRASGLYTFSDAFDRSYNDCSSYRIKIYDGAHALGFFNLPCPRSLTLAIEEAPVVALLPESSSLRDPQAMVLEQQIEEVEPQNNSKDPAWSDEDLKWLSEVEIGQWLGGAWSFASDTMPAPSETAMSSWASA